MAPVLKFGNENFMRPLISSQSHRNAGVLAILIDPVSQIVSSIIWPLRNFGEQFGEHPGCLKDPDQTDLTILMVSTIAPSSTAI